MLSKIIKKIYRIHDYYKKNGFLFLIRHIFYKLFHLEEMSYNRWRKKNRLSSLDIENEKKNRFPYMPLISIIVPLYRTPALYLTELIESIEQQTYGNWELCLSDGSGPGQMEHDLIEKYMRNDSRIKFITAEKQMAISDNTNNALKLATGDYISFMDHDDLLEPDTLYECVKRINQYPETDIIYTDEDKVSFDGKKYFQPHFKSGFNIDLLRNMNYICHFFLVKSEILQKVGCFRKKFDGAQDYDFILRCIESSNHIQHIPKILYHWRAHLDSTSENPNSKLYAFNAGRLAVEAHLKRCGISGQVEMGKYLGLYRVKYFLDNDPFVSILIPNKDHKEDLERCVDSIFSVLDYINFEIVIIENGSTQKDIFDYYNFLKTHYNCIKIVEWNQGNEFNFSSINNYGARYAAGEYLLFLNNDTEFLEKDSLKEMISYAVREDVGIVGARLYYPDGSIQHAGVILGLGGVAGHAFLGEPHDANGYFSRIICSQDYSAVTAACMLIEKKLFETVGGFDDNLKVAFNDIDLCLKVRRLNKLVVYTPFAELTHYESKSRGLEDTKSKIDRFNSEVSYFHRKWSKELNEGDVYYNPNLTLEKHDFSLKILH